MSYRPYIFPAACFLPPASCFPLPAAADIIPPCKTKKSDLPVAPLACLPLDNFQFVDAEVPQPG